MSATASVLPAAPVHTSGNGQPGAQAAVDTKPSCRANAASSRPLRPAPFSEESSHPTRAATASGDNGRSLAREDNRRAIRRRSMDIVAGANGDVRAFVLEMDQKRKTLDDQIHKFIAQKEREYKRYEQEMRTKYQTTQFTTEPQEEILPVLNPHAVSVRGAADDRAPEVARQTAADSATESENVRSRIDRRTANSGLEDVRPSSEREKDFMGLFIPSFLPMLDGKPELNRSPSAPILTESGRGDPLHPDRNVLQRANTEPVLDANRTGRPGFGQRTPSSSSEGLVSALKTSGPRKNPKPMRVMLQLADDQPAVHPNDDLLVERDYAPVRLAEAQHHSKRQEPNRFQSEEISPSPSPSPSLAPLSPEISTNETVVIPMRSGLTQGLASQSANSPATKSPSTVIGAETTDSEDLTSPFPLDEEVGDAQKPDSDWEVEFAEDVGQASRVSHSLSPVSIPNFSRSPPDISPDADLVRNSTTPTLEIRSSSSSSGQPISPGFSRPSVREDPIFEFATPEINDEADALVQGSFYDAFARQSYNSKNMVSGSLGQSYMQRNAEDMMRRRRS